MPLRKHIGELQDIYTKFNRRDLAFHDPIVFLYDYGDPDDREVAAVIASSLAYGRVAQILASVRKVLGRMGARPAGFLHDQSDSRLLSMLRDFKHRFTTGEDVAALLAAVRDTRRRCGSLRECFVAGCRGLGVGATAAPCAAVQADPTAANSAAVAPDPGQTTAPTREGDGDGTYLPAITYLAETLRSANRGVGKFLLPSPRGGSACKRLNLMLRWLIRRDAVDPGGWEGIGPGGLLIPLDTHMHRMCRAMGATRRKAANLATTLEVTAAFRTVCPQDPVRYDFAMTRQGILGTRRSAPAQEGGDCPSRPESEDGSA